MKASDLVRGRAAAFRLDEAHLSRRVDAWDTDEGSGLRVLQDRMVGYRLAAKELDVIADELERAGL